MRLLTSSSSNFFRTHSPPFGHGAVFGEYDLQRAKIVPTAGFGFRLVLDRAHQRCHWSHERIWNPHALQARREPIVGIALRHKFQGVRTAGRVIVHQADGSFDDPFRSLKPKDGVCVTLPGGVACIDQHLQTRCILPNRECLGLSLSLLAWSATATGKYVGRISQKIAERIDVVNTMKHYFEMFTLVDPRPETPVGV